MRFMKPRHTLNVAPAVLLNVPGVPSGRDLLVNPPSVGGGGLFIILPYGHLLHADPHSESAMKHLCTFGKRVAA